MTFKSRSVAEVWETAEEFGEQRRGEGCQCEEVVQVQWVQVREKGVQGLSV
ncbi:hypothetical protein BC938DRAFT_472066, partial [Jimgerdemannia flammicorona]